LQRGVGFFSVKDFSAWISQAAKNGDTVADATGGGSASKEAATNERDGDREKNSDEQSSGSSIKKLQRILEIEEMRQFSERLDRVMTVR
jgi:hypothetical protein